MEDDDEIIAKRFSPGTRVITHSLKNNELNGVMGIVLEGKVSDGRCCSTHRVSEQVEQ